MKTSVKIKYYAIYWLCKLVGYLPTWFLYYVLADVIYFIIYHIVRYRVKVTRMNLENSFPEKTQSELRRIERKFYRHLAEVFVDTIDLTSIGSKEFGKRWVMKEGSERIDTGGRSWIGAIAHYGSWEYFISYAKQNPGYETIGVYKPLHDEAFDLFYRRMRSRLGVTPVAMGNLIRHILTNNKNGVPMTIGLIADQTPPHFDINRWFEFLNQPTAFYHGLEKLAVRFGMPVYFVHIEKPRRGHYIYSYEEIYDGVEPVAEFEVTARYAKHLEDMIRERPELWMWTHKRWKHKPKNEPFKDSENVTDHGAGAVRSAVFVKPSGKSK